MMTKHKTEKREIRVFVSSTFIDLQEERDIIIRRTFPKLQNYCRKKGILFTGVDLRWGISPSQVEQGRTIRMCLDEINRCEPFFVNILGQRYGWIPTETELIKDNDLLLTYADLIQTSVSNQMSITEMEIHQGVFSKNGNINAFFFLGDEKVYHNKNLLSKIPEENAISIDKLLKLKSKIRTSEYKVYDGFTSPEELSNMVYEALKNAIDEKYPNAIDLTQLEEIEEAHQAYATSRKDYYFSRDNLTNQISESLLKNDKPVLLVGDSGTGKSAFVANFLDKFELNKQYNIIEHYVGATTSSEIDIFKHILHCLNVFHEISQGEQNNYNILLAHIKKYLLNTNEKWVIVIDAYNQVRDSRSGLKWLEELVNENISILVTCTDLEDYSEEKWKVYEMSAFSSDEIRTIITSLLKLNGKTIDLELQEMIISNEVHFNKFDKIEFWLIDNLYGKYVGHIGNALFLKIFVNEIIVSSKFDDVKNQIQYYLESNNLQELLSKVFARLENTFGEEIVKFAMLHIYAGKRGFSEQELALLASEKNISYIDLVELLNVLSTHLMNRGDKLDFFHVHIENEVVRRYLTTSSSLDDTRENIIKVFTNNIISNSIEEIAYQLYHLENNEFLADFLCNGNVFKELYEKNMFELMLYIRRLEKNNIPIIELLYSSCGESIEKIYFLVKFLYQVNRPKTAIGILENLLKSLDLNSTQHDLIVKIEWLLSANYFYLQDFNNAYRLVEKHYRQLDIITNGTIKNYIILNYVKCCLSINNYNEIETVFNNHIDNLDSKGKMLLTELYVNMQILRTKNKNKRSDLIGQLNKILDEKKVFFGDYSIEMAQTHYEFAQMLDQIGENEQAIEEKKIALNIFSKFYGDTSLVISDLNLEFGNFDKAFIQKAVLLGLVHNDTKDALKLYYEQTPDFGSHFSLLKDFLGELLKLDSMPEYYEVDETIKIEDKQKKKNKVINETNFQGFKFIHIFLLINMLVPPLLLGISRTIFMIFLILFGVIGGYRLKKILPVEIFTISFLPFIGIKILQINSIFLNIYTFFWLGRSNFGSLFTFAIYISKMKSEIVDSIFNQEVSLFGEGLLRFSLFIFSYTLGLFINATFQKYKKIKQMLLIGRSN